jgi:hypothetical protein
MPVLLSKYWVVNQTHGLRLEVRRLQYPKIGASDAAGRFAPTSKTTDVSMISVKRGI